MKAMKRMKRGAGPLARRAVALVLALAMALVGLAAPFATATAYASSSSSNAISDACSGVVRIYSAWTVTATNTDYGISDETTTGGLGSAFCVGEEGKESVYYVTNRHVVAKEDEEMSYYDYLDTFYGESTAEYYYNNYAFVDADGTYRDITSVTVEVTYKLAYIYILNDDYAYSTTTGFDTSHMTPCSVVDVNDFDEPDIAIIQAAEVVEGRVALAFVYAEKGALEQGEAVYALGYPSISEYIGADDDGDYNLTADVDDVTVTGGTVSRVTEDGSTGEYVVQHDATLNFGNSGGPLVNSDGYVVGVNAYGWQDESVYAAMTSNDIMDMLDANGIEYTVHDDDIPVVLIAGIAVAVVAVVVVVVVVLARRKKAAAPVAATASEPASAPAPAPAPVTAPAPAPVASPAIANDSGFRIQGQSGVFAGRRFAIAGQLRLGRDPSKNDLVFPGDTKGISGVHCVLGVDGNGQVTLMDLGSTYGTYLAQGQRLAAHQPLTLKPGDVFYLGSTDQQFVLVRKGGQ